jgi:hypothetical protein
LQVNEDKEENIVNNLQVLSKKQLKFVYKIKTRHEHVVSDKKIDGKIPVDTTIIRKIEQSIVSIEIY